MTDYGTIIGPGAIRFERLLPGPIERVWDYLTDAEKRRSWLAGGAMGLRPGARFQLHFKHSELTPHEEAVPERYRSMANGASLAAEVIACDPPRLLVHSWGDISSGASEVTYELFPQGDKVRLVLTHRRLDIGMMPSVASGWHTHLALLDARLEGRTPPPFWATQGALEQAYGERIADQAEAHRPLRHTG